MSTKSRKRLAISGVLAATLVGGAGMLIAPSSLGARHFDDTAQESQQLPKGIDIIKKYVEVTGGEAAYKNISSRVTKARFAIPMAGIDSDMTIYQQAPNKMATKLNLGPMGSHETATNGTEAWEVSTMTGPRLLSDEEAKTLLRQAAFDAQLNPEKYYTTIETVRTTDFAGEKVYEVKLISKGGSETTQFYSIESGLLVGQRSLEASQMGQIESRVTISDYRDVQGIKLPFKSNIEVPAMGMTQTMTITSIEHNKEIDPKVFAMPDEIKALKEQRDQKDKDNDEGSEN
ncbi:MAG: hypothetical protein ACNA8P_06605 [Phycisphaerales bacterium]